MHPHPNAQKAEPQEHQLDGPEKEVKQLRAALDALKAENEQLREQVDELTANKAVSDSIFRNQGRIARWLAKVGIRFSVGANLNDSIYALIRAWRSDGKLPERELTDVITAVIRRTLRVGLVGAVITIVPIALLVWQNFLIQEQIAQQAQISNATRRAELISTLYSRRECEAEDVNDCPLLASIRARVEAAIAFVELERAESSGSGPDLPYSGPNLAHIDLSNGDLHEVDFVDVTLSRANLQDAFLAWANLQGAALDRANLQDADLWGAFVQDAFLVLQPQLWWLGEQ